MTAIDKHFLVLILVELFYPGRKFFDIYVDRFAEMTEAGNFRKSR
jgi:hypothetical protein